MPTELIVNGEFSDGETGWDFNGNVLVAGSNSSPSATFSRGNTAVNGSIEQDIAVSPGQNATLTFEFGKVGLGSAAAEGTWEVFYLDSGGNEVVLTSGLLFDAVGPSTASGVDSTDNDVTADFEIPAGVTSVTLRFVDTTTNTTFSDLDIDNVSLLVCFAEGTRIETKYGSVAVEDIEVGALVRTADHGFQPLRRCVRRRVDSIDLTDKKLRPVRIMAGTLGNGLPARDLLVSRQHRMVISSRICERMFEANEVMVSAVRLTQLPGIFLDDRQSSVTYHHLIFDQHEVIYAEGAPTESFYPGPVSCSALPPEAMDELTALFPDLANDGAGVEMSRYAPPPKQQNRLIERHRKNDKALCR